MRKARILYVEDDLASARLLKKNLEETGQYEVCVQNWPEDALATARDFKPDLILLDIHMPRMLGGDVVEVFKGDEDLRTVPIALFTATVFASQVEARGGIIGEHPCLAKPARLGEIVQFIERNLPPDSRTGTVGT